MSYANWRLSLDYDRIEQMAGALMTRANSTVGSDRAFWLGAAEAYYALLERRDVPDKDTICFALEPAREKLGVER